MAQGGWSIDLVRKYLIKIENGGKQEQKYKMQYYNQRKGCEA